jgi:hypothetical protein
MMLPGAPHHDGVRQFIVLFLFLALLAGHGPGGRGWLPARGCARSFWWPPRARGRPALRGSTPFELAYYGEAVGDPGRPPPRVRDHVLMDAITGPVLD